MLGGRPCVRVARPRRNPARRVGNPNALPRLQAEVGAEEIRVHNGWIVFAQVDWLARAISWRAASYDKRLIANSATVAPLFDPGAVAGGLAVHLGQQIANHHAWVTISETDDAARAGAMATLSIA